MIANARECRITLAAVKRLEEGLAQPEGHRSGRDTLARHLVRAGIEGQLETLREQLREYEALRVGRTHGDVQR